MDRCSNSGESNRRKAERVRKEEVKGERERESQ